ncbi:MAG TPA: sigma-70 family RNA polymerase sigma factor [Pyrinomonadaceae bacterium]|nr:sigma-70 family RNA polymerase sigma factor [Pyrinomonadaceae bacterium]
MPEGYTEVSEIELAKNAATGDEAAFAEIVRRFSPRVFRVASRFFRQRELVEEAAQEAFLKAFVQLKNYEGRGSLEGWLTRVTTNTCLNLLRSAKRQPQYEVSPMTENEAEWLEDQMSNKAFEKLRSDEQKMVAADLVDRVIGTLKPDDRLVLILMDGEENSVKDVAEMTGWTESKVKVQAFRARGRMRKAVLELLERSKNYIQGTVAGEKPR